MQGWRDVVGRLPGAARKAKTADFDEVEIYSPKYRLLERLIRDGANRRDDCLWGRIADRAWMTVETAPAAADIWNGDRVGVRPSPFDRSVGNAPFVGDPRGTHGHLVERLCALGSPSLHGIEGQTRGDCAKDAFDFHAVRRAFGGRYITNTGYSRETTMSAIACGHADLAGFGRLFIADQDLKECLRRDARWPRPPPGSPMAVEPGATRILQRSPEFNLK